MRRSQLLAVGCIALAAAVLLLLLPAAAAQTPPNSTVNASSSSSSSSSPVTSSSSASLTSVLSSSVYNSSALLSSQSGSSSSSTGASASIGGASTGLIVYGVICFICVICFTSFLLNLYARPGTPPAALFLTWLSWLMTFSICFLVPIDLLPGVETSLDGVWTVLYWMAFFLMWLIIPFASGYYDNGGFTFRQRCVASLRFNATLAAVCIVVAGAGVIYLVAKAQWSGSDISGMVLCASTTWGLIMLVVSAGWGLVEVPRGISHYINAERRRNYLYFTAASIHHEAEEARDELVAIIILLRLLEPRMYAKVDGGGKQDERKDIGGAVARAKAGRAQQLRKPRDLEEEEEGEGEADGEGDESTSLSTQDGGDASLAQHRLHFSYFKQIQSLVREKEAELEALTKHPHPFDLPFKQELLAASLSPASLSLKQLTALHYQTITTSKKLTLVETQWRDTVDGAVSLERDVANEGNARQSSWFLRTGKRRIVYAAYVCSVVLSVVILFCEITVPASAQVSPLGWLVSLTRSFFLSEQVFTAVPLLYLTLCAYHPLFQLKLGTLYYLGRHRTDEGTLLLNCTLLLRISVPLAYNFTLLLHVDAGSLQAFLGPISVIPFFGTSFNTIFPVFMAVISLLVLSRLVSRLLVCLNVTSLRFELVKQSADDPEIKDLMDEGKLLIANELKKRARLQHAAGAGAASANGAAAGAGGKQGERTVVDGLADRVKAKLAERERARQRQSEEVRETIVELGAGRAGRAERQHRSDELAGAMGEGLDTEAWRADEDADATGDGSSGDAFYQDSAASSIGLGLVGDSSAALGDEAEQQQYYEEERVYDEDGFDQDGYDMNGYDRYGGYYDEEGNYIDGDQQQQT